MPAGYINYTLFELLPPAKQLTTVYLPRIKYAADDFLRGIFSCRIYAQNHPIGIVFENIMQIQKL
jgi:hypothetical protein